MKRPLAGFSILIVEDESLVVMLAEDVLLLHGCESVAAAATVDDAIALIKGQHFDATMLDLNLRGEISYRVADELIAHQIPFFFATGNTASSLMDGYKIHPILRKPYSDLDLVQAFTRILP